jgi:hypothetical protein
MGQQRIRSVTHARIGIGARQATQLRRVSAQIKHGGLLFKRTNSIP